MDLQTKNGSGSELLQRPDAESATLMLTCYTNTRDNYMENCDFKRQLFYDFMIWRQKNNYLKNHNPPPIPYQTLNFQLKMESVNCRPKDDICSKNFF